jgi:protein-S-isoprenylcysteine O-methyltransferase Ste14
MEPFLIRYGNWPLAGLYILLGAGFLYGLLRPRRKADWRSAGAAQAFVIALYAEMYGLPLTMYLAAWLTGRTEFAQDHFHGHAWAYLFGWGDLGAVILDVLGQMLLVAGAVLALVGWRQIHRGNGALVSTGLYRRIRHPQYTGFFLFLLGSVVNWPTLPTLLMLPFLLGAYYRLARREEAEAQATFGQRYEQYRRQTGMFLPRFPRRASPALD